MAADQFNNRKGSTLHGTNVTRCATVDELPVRPCSLGDDHVSEKPVHLFMPATWLPTSRVLITRYWCGAEVTVESTHGSVRLARQLNHYSRCVLFDMPRSRNVHSNIRQDVQATFYRVPLPSIYRTHKSPTTIFNKHHRFEPS